MSKNIKFAVVREDPQIEAKVIEKINAKNILMIASGGCTALSLQGMFPEINISLFDINNEQIRLIKKKLLELSDFNNEKLGLFNIEYDNHLGLNGCGEFESLFRSFRNFINEFIITKEKAREIFTAKDEESGHIVKELISNKYWSVAFDLFFSNSLLLAMFGPDAVQHAKPGSYPKYFQNALEAGFKRADYKINYLLQHIILGYYINNKESLPYYLAHHRIAKDFEYINDHLLNINDLKKYQLISLSNIFDWMSEDQVNSHLQYLNENIAKDTYIIFRQLNNDKNYIARFDNFKRDDNLEKVMLKLDRSMFYNKINIIKKLG